jgi:hypothetical protein
MRLLSLVIVLSITAVVVLATPTPSPVPSPVPSPSPSPKPVLKRFLRWAKKKLRIRRRPQPQQVQPPNQQTYSFLDFVNPEAEVADPILAALFAKIEAENDVKGVYRVGGNQGAIDTAFENLKTQFPAIRGGAAPVLPQDVDMTLAGDLVKRYLRGSSDRILTTEQAQQLATKNLETARNIINGLDRENAYVLDQILEHIHTLIHDKHALMNANGFARLFSTFVFPEATGLDGIQAPTDAFEYLIEHEAELFPEVDV